MADQMTPAEMRETAKRLRGDAGPRGTIFDDQQAQDERAGADALDRLAEIREAMTGVLAESDADEAEGGAGWDIEVDARWVMRLAGGCA